MYDLIKQLIDHSWNSQVSSSVEQQYIYYIAGSLILILVTVVIDLLYRFIRSLFRKGDF